MKRSLKLIGMCLALLPVLDRADLRPRPGRRPPSAERR